jgi:hypothetical protein
VGAGTGEDAPGRERAQGVEGDRAYVNREDHDPSIGDVMPSVLTCELACVMAVEFKIGTAGARMVKVRNTLTALRLIAVPFRWLIMSFSFEFEIYVDVLFPPWELQVRC